MKIIKQIAPSGKNSMKSLTMELESLIYTVISAQYPVNWDSGAVTRSLFSGMKQLFDNKIIRTPGNAIQTSWRIKRLKTDPEKILGDIAFLVQIAYHDGQVVRGAALLDTALKDPGKNTFSSLNKNRIKKLTSTASHASLLLYDYDPICGMAFPSTVESIIGSHPHTWNSWMPYTYAATVPAGLMMSIDNKTTGLYKISLPLSYQLCYRYLYGLDLDHSVASLETAAGLRPDRGIMKYLIMISISHGGAEPLTSFDYNDKLYTDFE
ncbi:MAG: hypothetical protein JXA07_00280 [Spirochaetes bacterium]|nr:hypothetical protein [Spirochaetota bacterium]